MSYTTITSSGVTTNYHYDNDEFYTTKSIDEVILFKNKNNERVTLNACTISSGNLPLKIAFIRTKDNSDDIGHEDDIIYIPANYDLNHENTRVQGVKVYGVIGQKVAWRGNFY